MVYSFSITRLGVGTPVGHERGYTSRTKLSVDWDTESVRQTRRTHVDNNAPLGGNSDTAPGDGVEVETNGAETDVRR